MPRSSCSRHHAESWACLRRNVNPALRTGPLKNPFFSPVCLRGTSSRTVGELTVGPGPKSQFNSAYCGPQGTGKGSCSLYSNPKENEQAPVIPLCNCCASTRRPIETGPIFRNSFMTFLTHMQFHGLKTKIPALLEFMLGSPFLIFPFLLQVISSVSDVSSSDWLPYRYIPTGDTRFVVLYIYM